MSKWREVRLSSLADIYSGFAFSSKDMQSEGIPIIKIGNIKNKVVLSQCDVYFPKDKVLERHKRYFLDKNDILIAMTGAGSVGKFGKMFKKDKEYLVNQRVGIIRANENVNAIFLYYILTIPNYESYLYNIGIGAGQPNISAKDIGSVYISTPDLATQEKIADLLSTYDELIENNNRRIEILEKTAEEIYKEWFVRMRFPGYENTKFIKGIPEGWEVKRVGDLGEVITGKTPSTKKEEYYGGNIMFVKTPDMNNNTFVMNTEVYLSKDGSDSQALKLLPKNSIMVNCIGANAGESVSLNIEEAHTNQQINSIVLEDTMYREWVYLTVKNLKEIIKLTAATGATMPNLSKGKFERLKILFSTNETIKEFNNNTKDIFENIKVLMLNNQNLIKQRDLLLPRLMNGTIQVK